VAIDIGNSYLKSPNGPINLPYTYTPIFDIIILFSSTGIIISGIFKNGG